MTPLRQRRSSLRHFDLPSRRGLLRAAGGIAVGLPLLDGLGARRAYGNDPARRFVCFFQPCGVDVDTFWPTRYGALADDSMPDTTGVGPLRAWKHKLLIPRGLHSVPRGHNREGIRHNDHTLAGQCRLTAATHSDATRAANQSIDSLIAARKNPRGRGPLILGVGRNRGNFPGASLSYDEAGRSRPRIDDPKVAYERLVGLGEASAASRAQILQRRQSILDVVRGDFEELQNDPALSRADRRKLDMHFTNIRELETGLAATCRLRDELAAELRAVPSNRVLEDALFPQMGKLQSAILGLAIACDYTRAAVIMWGTTAGGPVHSWLGHTHEHHLISHRVIRYDSGVELQGARQMLHQIDRWHAARLAELLAQLDAYDEGAGTALDNTVIAWLNELSEGKMHHFRDMPVVLAGSCGGYFKTGEYVKVTRFADPLANSDKARVEDAPHNKLLTMFANACGVREANGAPLVKFGQWGDPGEYAELRRG